MPTNKHLPDSQTNTVQVTGPVGLAGDVWIPQSTLQEIPNANSGSLVFTSGALYVASGDGSTWHYFNLNTFTPPEAFSGILPNHSSISGSLLTWFTAEDAVVSTGSGLTSIADRSPSGATLNPANISVTSGIIGASGYGALYFNGVNSSIKYSTQDPASKHLGTTDDNPFTVVVVFKPVSFAINQMIFGAGNSASNTPYIYLTQADVTAQPYGVAARQQTSARIEGQIGQQQSGLVADQWYIYTFCYSGSQPGNDETPYLNGSGAWAVASGLWSNEPAIAVDQCAWGTLPRITDVGFSHMYIAEATLYSNALARSGQQALETYFAWKYGITIAAEEY